MAMFSAKALPVISWLLLILLVSTTSTTASSDTEEEDTCQTFNSAGICWTESLDNEFNASSMITSQFGGDISQYISASQDETVASVHDQFIEPLLQIAVQAARTSTSSEDEGSTFCFGDFEGTLFQAEEHDLGCSSIPLDAGLTFGTVGSSFEISPSVQSNLVSRGLWNNDGMGAVQPVFCMGMRLPTSTCQKWTFGMTLNNGTLLTLTQVTPTGGVGGALLRFLLSLSESVLGTNESITLAVSFGDGLDVPVKYYADRKFVRDDFHAHLYFSYKGNIALSMMREAGMEDIIQVDGPYTRGFNLGHDTNTVETELETLFTSSAMTQEGTTGPEIITVLELFLSNFPEVITTKEKLIVNLEGVTRGLFKGFTIEGSEIKALKLPSGVNHDMHAGFYLNVDVETNLLQPIVQTICDDMEGPLILVSGAGCPNLNNPLPKGKLGLELRQNIMELLIQWPDFFLRCRVRDLNTDNPKVNCQIDSVAFTILEEDAGYVIGKADHISSGMVEKITEIPKHAVTAAGGKFRKSVAVSAKLSSAAAEEHTMSVTKFFGGTSPVTFNFEPTYHCKDSHRLWDSIAKKDYEHYFSQYGNDASRASCFESCNLYLKDHPEMANGDGDLCCEYEELHFSSKSCRVGNKGRQHGTNHKKSATATFQTDYDAMVNAAQLGSPCAKDEDCVTGFCHDHKCKLECSKSCQCFGSPFSKCFGQNDACLHINGINHVCDMPSDSCMCDESSGRCNRSILEESTQGLMEVTRDVSAESDERRLVDVWD